MTLSLCVPAGLRHFPEQATDTPLEDDPQRHGNFEMRSTAEVYELFERLQQQQQSSRQQGGGDGGGVDLREAAADVGPAIDQAEEALQRSGPLTGTYCFVDSTHMLETPPVNPLVKAALDAQSNSPS